MHTYVRTPVIYTKHKYVIQAECNIINHNIIIIITVSIAIIICHHHLYLLSLLTKVIRQVVIQKYQTQTNICQRAIFQRLFASFVESAFLSRQSAVPPGEGGFLRSSTSRRRCSV